MTSHYRGTCRPDDPPCYVFIRYGISRHQSCINSLIKQFSIHGNYTGKVEGISAQVENVEGDGHSRHGDKGLALLRFECQCEADKWYYSTPEIKQQDWLDGVDIVAVQAKEPIDVCRPWLEVMDMDFTDYDRFLQEYVVKVNPYLDTVCAKFGVVVCKAPKVMRGMWNPSHLIVNQFRSKEDFMRAFTSEEYKPLKELRQKTACANVSLCEIKPLK